MFSLCVADSHVKTLAGLSMTGDKAQTQAQRLYPNAVAHFKSHMPTRSAYKMAGSTAKPQGIHKRGLPLRPLALTHESFWYRLPYPWQQGTICVSHEAVLDYCCQVFCLNPWVSLL